MQSLYIKFNTQICLRSKQTLKYFEYDTTNQIASALSPPPYTALTQQSTIIETKPKLVNKLRIIMEQKDTKNMREQQYLTYGSKVHFLNANGEYLAYSSKSELKFDQRTIDDQLNAMLLKTATWIVMDLNNTPSLAKKPVTVYDDICFKSVYLTYLICLENGDVNVSGVSAVQSACWNIMKADTPYIPAWVYQRPVFNKFMSLDPQHERQAYFQQSIRSERKSLLEHSPNIQEMLLIQDILDVMLGFEGVYIKKRPNSFHFVIEPHLENPSCSMALVQLSTKILDLPAYYYIIQNYISTYSIEQGTVCQALCGGLRVLIKQYKMMVVQLDQQVKNGLTLQKIWYFIQPSLRIMKSLYELIKQAQKLKGGQLISCITKMLNSTTDQQIISIYNFLFGKTITVYIKIISEWIYQGIIQDKHQEFMIMPEQKHQNKQWTLWEQKYSLRRDQIPTLFEKDSHLILVTGKYLNIMKQCGKMIQHPFCKQIEINLQKYLKQQDFTQSIHKAYQWANQQLQNLVFKEYNLIQVLKSIKGYFFLQFGDFFVHFMELAENDLSELKSSKFTSQSKNKQSTLSVQKLQNLFQLLIRTSSANNDPYKEQVSCHIDNSSLYQQIHRIKTLEPQVFNPDISQKPYLKKQSKFVDFFTLNYKRVFPLNLIINQKSMLKYQVLFRYIFWCKFLQRQLNNVWLTLQSTKQVPLKFYRQSYLLNQRMINYIKNLIYYLSYQIIQQNWLIFIENIKKVKTFQDIIYYHNQFLNKCLIESLLVNNKLLPIITIQLGNACQGFFKIKNYLGQLGKDPIAFYANPSDSILTQRRKKRQQMAQFRNELMDTKNFTNAINGYSQNFDNAMRKLLREIYSIVGKQESHLICFLDRLDQEKFYNKRFFNNSQNYGTYS